MKINQTKLIHELKGLTDTALLQIKQLYDLPDAILNHKASKNDWSILECIEHLNRYGDFYLPEIERQIEKAKPLKRDQNFKSGVLGNYFVNMIKASNSKKIKATKQMDSTGSKLNKTALDQFQKQLKELNALLTKACKVDLVRVKTAISLSKLIKLRLGDTLRFLVYHNERHLLQVERVKHEASKD